MVTKPIIKICGIRDPNMAQQAVMAGADLIGIIFHPTSPRYVTIEQARAISHATQMAGAKPVAVFVNQTHHEIREICERTRINIVQLHGTIARAHQHLLPDTYQRIYVLDDLNHERFHTDPASKTLDAERDWMMIDHHNPGQGHQLNWDKLKVTTKTPPTFRDLSTGSSDANRFMNPADKQRGIENTGREEQLQHKIPFTLPWMLAGGLTPTNVRNACEILRPDGVDVSSGVESTQGSKNIALIQHFIQSIRGDQHDRT